MLEKRERALGTRLFPKAERSFTPKSAAVTKPYPPGQRKKRGKRNASEYGKQLLEKQRLRFTYGVTERTMRRVFELAERAKDPTGAMFLRFLEERLDNVVFRLGFAPSRAVARQLVGHGHIAVNDRRVRTPSRRVAVGEVITFRKESAGHPLAKSAPERLKRVETPVWLELDKSLIAGRMVSSPKDIETLLDMNLIVDFYSK
ncbi:MAG: 30S ribosomal protein S4 [Candidatus Colwellbacteria bacterium]|nr:30S ribosomal protein S4 [Candidatus Colwellbacteria bacterium]